MLSSPSIYLIYPSNLPFTSPNVRCVIDVELDAPPALRSNRTCWPKCRFTKAVPPRVPEQCWNYSG